jgi:hypothetical protein
MWAITNYKIADTGRRPGTCGNGPHPRRALAGGPLAVATRVPYAPVPQVEVRGPRGQQLLLCGHRSYRSSLVVRSRYGPGDSADRGPLAERHHLPATLRQE